MKAVSFRNSPITAFEYLYLSGNKIRNMVITAEGMITEAFYRGVRGYEVKLKRDMTEKIEFSRAYKGNIKANCMCALSDFTHRAGHLQECLIEFNVHSPFLDSRQRREAQAA